MKKIIVLGAGYAGVEAALSLHKKLSREDAVISIIDKNEYHTLLTELHEFAGNRVEEGSVKIDLRDIFKFTKVNIIKDEIQDIDFENQLLKSPENQYDYDYLVIGCGSEPAYFGIEGMKENAFSLWSLEDAKNIKGHIINMFQKASKETDETRRKAYLTFVVGGGGFTGIELIGELIHFANVLSKEYGISRKEVSLVIVEAADKILTVLHQSLIDKSMKYLEKNKVQILTNSPIIQVTKDRLKTKADKIIDTHTVIWTGGVKVNSFIEKLELPQAERGRGRIEVNQHTQSTKYSNVFLVGDNSFFIGANQRPLPLMVEPAIQTGDTAAHNIVNLMRNKPLIQCKPKLHGTMVSIGRKYAVADNMGMRTSGFAAMLIKHVVNIHYQFGVGGFEQVIHYLKHQFVYDRKDDSMIKRNLTAQSYTIFLVFMRIYLGYKWLMQGAQKINEGWLSNVVIYAQRVAANLPEGITNPSPAANSATEAAQKGMNLIGEHTPEWYIWFTQSLVVPNAIWFQRMIVLIEVGLGIAFITGTFTFVAALISIGMNLNFALSTGLYDLWYLVTSVACLAGAGRAFGIDHYLMPWLMRQWRYFIRNRRVKIRI